MLSGLVADARSDQPTLDWIITMAVLGLNILARVVTRNKS